MRPPLVTGCRRAGWTVAVLLLWASVAVAEEPERPAFRFLRQNEDWSVLAKEDHRTGWDRIKYVRLSDGDGWASFGGTVRWRTELWRRFGFSESESDVFSVARLLAHGDFHFGPRVRVFAEAKVAVATDRDLPGDKRPIDVDNLDLQQGFADVNWQRGESRTVTLRVGRQAFSYGRQRLVSPLPWANSLRSWDGFDVRCSGPRWVVDSFYTWYAPADPHDFNEPDSDLPFFGVYASRHAPGHVVETYALGVGRPDATFNGTIGDEDRYTVGGRWARTRDRLRLEAEAAFQLGQVGQDDVRAWMATFEVGRPFPDAPTSPRFAAVLDYASGDGSAGGKVGTFNQLFPLGHAFLGIMDFVGRQNVMAASAGFDQQPWSRGRLVFRAHAFWRASVEDALYNAGAIPIRSGSPGSSRYTGTELDLVLRHAFSPHLGLEGGGGYFFPGAFIEETGPSEDMKFLYLQVEYRI